MRQYRPTIEHLKRRYSADMARRKRLDKIIAQRPPGTTRVQIPDNSELWLPHPPTSLADCIWIATQVNNRVESWKTAFLPTTS